MKTFSSFIVASFFLAVSNCQNIRQEYEEFIRFYERTFATNREKEARLRVFEQNYNDIMTANENDDGYTLRVTETTDLTFEAFGASYLGWDTSEAPPTSRRLSTMQVSEDSNLRGLSVASEIDWVDRGYVGHVENQAGCASSYAHAVMALLEIETKRALGAVYELSVENFLRCDNGCSASRLDVSFQNALAASAWCTENSFDTSLKGCNSESCWPRVRTSALTNATVKATLSSEEDLLAALQDGPVVAAVRSKPAAFRFHESGIIPHSQCDSGDVDHLVLVVGYGALDGVRYWKIQNSWGIEWGQNGYALLARDNSDSHGTCGLYRSVFTVTPVDASSWDGRYLDFVKTYYKTFSTFEKREISFDTYVQNYGFITYARFPNVKMKVNHLADMTAEEFATTHLGFRLEDDPRHLLMEEERPSENEGERSLQETPAAIDWVAKGDVAPVVHQDGCAASYAYAASAAYFSYTKIFLNRGYLVSEEQIIDCSADRHHKCEHGTFYNSLQYIVGRRTYCTRNDYTDFDPSAERCQDNRCTATLPSPSAFSLTLQHRRTQEAELRRILSRSPVPAAMRADSQQFKFYGEGVVHSYYCLLGQLNHAVLIVGYGVLNNLLYWKVKNSWGTAWGEDGYVLVERVANYTGRLSLSCGLLDHVGIIQTQTP
jgi:C1A family cysteine protease